MDKLLKTVQEIVRNVTGKKNVTYETDFIKDLALNSFDIVNIVCAFEDKYDVSVPTRDLWKLRRVEDVIDYMRRHGVEG